MKPSDENTRGTSSSRNSSNFIPAVILFLVLITIAGILFYLKSESNQPFSDTPVSGNASENSSSASAVLSTTDTDSKEPSSEKEYPHVSVASKQEAATEMDTIPSDAEVEQNGMRTDTSLLPGPGKVDQETKSPPSAEATIPNLVAQCEKTTKSIDLFYQHLDKQQYMTAYRLPTSSKIHFTNLIQKLLANPPQVTRETDDLYTILKNTAHFFRISGKDNILMMKGILDSERSSVEKILADYYFLISCPECSDTPYAMGIDQNAIYEYACFFLNTMGGRLYLFRRDALSRMVVTYYAILLINQANEQNNNRHGIALQPAIDMLIAEMEGGGSALKQQKSYLDTLYLLKERYQ